MKINILTPTQGGPYSWGKDLECSLNQKGITAESINKLMMLITSPLYQDADIVHTAVPMIYRLWNKPVIITVHGEYTIESNMWRFIYPMAIKKADIVTTPSQFLKERLGLDGAIVIPNAIFPDKFSQAKHSDRDIVNLVTVTKFYFDDKSQGVLNIIRILDKIQKNVDNKINYTVIGDGIYLEQIKKRAKEYNVNVKFMGMLQNPREILQMNDIFLYYSSHDNFPISLLEAMASGLPVVSNNVGAVNEMIKNSHNGFILSSDDDYAEKVSALINDYNLRQYIGQNSRMSVELKFDWNVVSEKYIRLYEKLY